MDSNSASVGHDGSIAGARAPMDRVGETAAGALNSVRAKTGDIQAGLADLLDSSAQTIRSRGVAASEAAGGAVGDGAAERLVQSGEATAAVLERGAMWLRENDLSDVEARLTAELKRHPARTLLVAAGIGFLFSRRR